MKSTCLFLFFFLLIKLYPNTASSSSFFIVKSIYIEGNKITKDKIIHRELLFKINDTIKQDLLPDILSQSKENLNNTSLFNFVYITDSLDSDSISIIINIKVIERWYIWPWPIFELSDRNFNVWWQSKDFSRTCYGFYLVRDNFRGRKENLKLRIKLGYEEEYVISYSIPYVNKKQTVGLGFSSGFSRQHEISYATLNDKHLFLKDENKYLNQKYYSLLQMSIRKNIHNSHIFQLQYYNYNIPDTIIVLNEDYSFLNQKHPEFIGFYYLFKSDFRNNKAYPLTGHYFDFSLSKKGFGILNNKKLDFFYLKSSLRKYWKFSDKFYFASGLSAKLSNNKFQPYFLQQGLGFGRDFVRGYEYYVIDGQHYGLLKNNIKYELFSPKILNLNFIPIKQFSTLHYAIYINVFSDIGYVINNQNYSGNNLADELLPGTGIGIDFVTYYDKVLRFEYSFNKMGEGKFFLHFMSSI